VTGQEIEASDDDFDVTNLAYSTKKYLE